MTGGMNGGLLIPTAVRFRYHRQSVASLASPSGCLLGGGVNLATNAVKTLH
jgi:hypothetical protein